MVLLPTDLSCSRSRSLECRSHGAPNNDNACTLTCIFLKYDVAVLEAFVRPAIQHSENRTDPVVFNVQDVIDCACYVGESRATVGEALIDLISSVQHCVDTMAQMHYDLSARVSPREGRPTYASVDGEPERFLAEESALSIPFPVMPGSPQPHSYSVPQNMLVDLTGESPVSNTRKRSADASFATQGRTGSRSASLQDKRPRLADGVSDDVEIVGGSTQIEEIDLREVDNDRKITDQQNRDLQKVASELRRLPRKFASTQCVICMADISDATTTPCGHIFCGTCIRDYMTRKEQEAHEGKGAPKCPICRKKVLMRDLLLCNAMLGLQVRLSAKEKGKGKAT